MMDALWPSPGGDGSGGPRAGEPASGRVVAITGASAGVGRATAAAFGRAGARVALLARGRAGLEAAEEEVESLGGQALALPTDVADPDAVEEAAGRAEEELGPVDVWINNAMTSVFSPIHEMKAEEYRRVTEVTYLGYVHGTLSALRRMRPRDRGVVVNVGSALAFRSIPLQSAYCAAKHAIQGFTESLRVELLHDGSNVRVTEVHLPALNTPQFVWVKSRLSHQSQPLPPIFQPEVAAEAIRFAVEHDRRHVWVGAMAQMTAVGNHLAPGYMDRYLAEEGYEGQMTGEAAPSGRDNLWSPVDDDRDHGAHGPFDDRASERSFHLWANQNRGLVAATGGAILGGVLALVLGRGRSRETRVP